jgi:tetratricopeptide (TPR) repeat protein
MRERLRALQGQPSQQTLDACCALLAEAEAAGIGGEVIALLTMVSHAHSRLGDRQAAERVARECVRLADLAGDRRLRADALTRLGITLIEQHPRESVALFRRALALFAELDDVYGQARCHLNLGSAWLWAGDAAEAERAFATALDTGRTARAPDQCGAASVNLGVLYMKWGRYDDSRARLEEALQLFTTVRNEPYRLGTLYNMAHLARERADGRSALELYRSAEALARQLGQSDVEIGALAGAGLASLALGDGGGAERAWERATRLLASRTGWWFQGRETFEALGVRAALVAGDAALAAERFHASLALTERHDGYAAAWLVAECARPLADAGCAFVWEVVARFGLAVSVLDSASLSARYAALAAGRPVAS